MRYLPDLTGDGPRPPHVERPSVPPTEGMQVYDKNPSRRRVGRVIGVQGSAVIVKWRDGTVSRAAYGGECAPTSYRGV